MHTLLFPRTCICSHEPIPDSAEKNDDQTLFLLPWWEESGLRGKPAESKCAGQSGPRVPGEPQNQKLQVHRKQFSQLIKKLFYLSQNDEGGHKSLVNKWTTFSEGQAGVLCDGRWWGGNLSFDELSECCFLSKLIS